MENFGQKLLKARKERNLTIEQIAEKTKIRHQILSAFENGKFDVLPPVYAKSFLKTHANFLGFTDDVIEKAMKDIFEVKPKKEEPEEIPEIKPVEKPKFFGKKTPKAEQNIPDSIKEEPKFETRKLDRESLDNLFFGNKEKNTSKLKAFLKYAAIGIVGVAAIIFIIILFMPDGGNNSSSFVKEADKMEDTLKAGTDVLPAERIVLTARAIDTTSFKIHVDNQTDESITLYPGKTKEWEAEEKFELSGVTVGEVEFIRDGIVLEPFGTKGSIVRNITIYKDRVVSSSVDVEQSPDTTATFNSPDTIP